MLSPGREKSKDEIINEITEFLYNLEENKAFEFTVPTTFKQTEIRAECREKALHVIDCVAYALAQEKDAAPEHVESLKET